MKLKRSDKSQAAALEAGYYAKEAAYKNRIEQNREEIGQKLAGIVDLVKTAPIIPASMREYNLESIGHTRYMGRPIRIARFIDGFGVAGMERQADVIRTHRIIVDPNHLENTIYIRNIACDTYQESLPTRMELGGSHNPEDIDVITRMAEDEMAMHGLRLISELASRQYASGWQACAYDVRDLGVMHKGEAGLSATA